MRPWQIQAHSLTALVLAENQLLCQPLQLALDLALFAGSGHMSMLVLSASVTPWQLGSLVDTLSPSAWSMWALLDPFSVTRGLKVTQDTISSHFSAKFATPALCLMVQGILWGQSLRDKTQALSAFSFLLNLSEVCVFVPPPSLGPHLV